MEKIRCEFCGKLTYTAGTALVGCYCIPCHKINIEESRDAIKEIKEKRRGQP